MRPARRPLPRRHHFALAPLVLLAACGARQSAPAPAPATPVTREPPPSAVNWSSLPLAVVACRADSDCVIGQAYRPVRSMADCYCGPRCGQTVVNRETHDASEASFVRFCTSAQAVALMNCPRNDCAFGPGRPVCRSGRCTGDQ